MRRTLSAAVLILAFCCPAAAGIIHNPAPEPDPLVEEVAPDTTDTTDTEPTAPAVYDGLTQVTLDLLAVLPALF